MVWIGVAAVVVLVAVGGWYMFLRADERSTADIEDEIHSWADERTEGGGAITVECPDPIEWRVGETFHCILSQGEQTVGVTVTMENDDGAVTWRAG